MRRMRGRRERNLEAAELNITAFMNLMVILVPFLLITAVFSRVAIWSLICRWATMPRARTNPIFICK